MAASEVDTYLAGLDAPARAALQGLREMIRALLPEAEEGLAYGMPAFRVDGRAVAGYGAFADHLSYLPHSGSVLAALADDLEGWHTTKGSLHFAVDDPLPAHLVAALVDARLRELGLAP